MLFAIQFKLNMMQLRIDTIFIDQFAVIAAFDNTTSFHDKDEIGILNG